MKKICISLCIILFTCTAIAQEDSVLYSFITTNNKVVELSYNESENIFIYRFISNNKIELEVQDNLNDEEIIFSVHGYHRGGGIQNAAMDYHDLIFSNNEYDYDIYYVWSVNEEDEEIENDPIFGIKVFKDGTELADIKGKKIITGYINGWSFYDILPEMDESNW